MAASPSGLLAQARRGGYSITTPAPHVFIWGGKKAEGDGGHSDSLWASGLCRCYPLLFLEKFIWLCKLED